MKSKFTTEDLILETKRYEFLDGMRDIQLGVFFILMGIAFWIGFQPFWWRMLLWLGERTEPLLMMMVAILLLVLPALIAVLLLPLMKVIRQRWLWRESGMVTPLRQAVPMGITMVTIVVFLVSSIIGLLVGFTQGLPSFFAWNLLWTVTGWSFGSMLLMLGMHLKIKRYTWLGIIGGLASCVIMWATIDLTQPVLVFGLGWGILLLVSGLVVLALRRSAVARVNHDG